MRNLLMLSLVISTLVAACSGTATRTSGSRDTITAEEVTAARGNTAWEIVSDLRPHFLQPQRGGTAASLPVVYLDGSRLGDIDRLRSISASSIDRIQFIGAADATTRWGTGHVGGVILVHSRR